MKKRGNKEAAEAKPRRRRAMRRRRSVVKDDALSLLWPVPDKKLQALKIRDLYRPRKTPITVRIDADVLAWFKKDGRRYQTRINEALRRVMEREMKEK